MCREKLHLAKFTAYGKVDVVDLANIVLSMRYLGSDGSLVSTEINTKLNSYHDLHIGKQHELN